MKSLFLTLFFLLNITQVIHANEYFIDNYTMEWKILSGSNLDMSIVKNEESTYVSLYKREGLSSYLRLTADEAVTISKVLSKTREYQKKQKGTQEDISKSLPAGNYTVTFRTSIKYGFSATIRRSKGFSMDTFVLKRTEAIKLYPKLAEANEMIKFINGQIDF